MTALQVQIGAPLPKRPDETARACSSAFFAGLLRRTTTDYVREGADPGRRVQRPPRLMAAEPQLAWSGLPRLPPGARVRHEPQNGGMGPLGWSP